MKKTICILMIILMGTILVIPQNIEASGRIVIRFRDERSLEVVIDNTSDTGEFPLGGSLGYIKNTTNVQKRYIIFPGSFELNESEVYKVVFTFFVPDQVVANPGNVSIYALEYQKGAFLNFAETNWTMARDTQAWDTPGGDYNSTPLDTFLVNDATIGPTGTAFNFNITTYALKSEQTNQVGLIVIGEDGTDFIFQGTQAYSNYKIYYKGGSGAVTNLYEEVWNLEGFSNITPKLASAIYSEISDCTALSWKNDITGYWYTYWPSLGLTEDELISFGDGLFILTDLNTTWDHT